MNANPISTVGLMLTLAGLVGSFFNIQLSQWLREVIAVHEKTKLNRVNSTEAQQRAIVECRIEFAKLSGTQVFVINGLVLAFVIFVLLNGLAMANMAMDDPLHPYVHTALWVFLVFFTSLSLWLFYQGWTRIGEIRQILEMIR